MDIRPLTAAIAVSPQIRVADFAALAADGFTTVINNRPDGEEPGQPSSDAMESAARAAGLAYHHIPVTGGAISPDQIARFDAALHGADGKVLAYCRSGTRSAMLWAMGAAPAMGAEAVLAAARTAGYDLTALTGALRGRAGAGSGAEGLQP